MPGQQPLYRCPKGGFHTFRPRLVRGKFLFLPVGPKTWKQVCVKCRRRADQMG